MAGWVPFMLWISLAPHLRLSDSSWRGCSVFKDSRDQVTVLGQSPYLEVHNHNPISRIPFAIQFSIFINSRAYGVSIFGAAVILRQALGFYVHHFLSLFSWKTVCLYELWFRHFLIFFFTYFISEYFFCLSWVRTCTYRIQLSSMSGYLGSLSLCLYKLPF